MKSLRWLLGGALTAALVACGGNGETGNPAGNSGEPDEETATAAERAVRTAAEPTDPCGWIPVSEVEAVIGKLAEPPKQADGCRYTMVMPEAVSSARSSALAKQKELNDKLKAAFKDWEPPEYGGSMASFQSDPKTYAVTLNVEVKGSMAGEMGTEAAIKVMKSWIPAQPGGDPSSAAEPAAPAGPAGWDARLPAPYGFSGRIGHLQISVLGEAPDVPRELSEALAARVRDRIPDLPFAVTNPYQIIDTMEKPPCSLLTRAEAEAVLGPLIVEPYRSSSEWPPLVHGDGHACAYYTADHHVFVLSPTWSGGGDNFNIEKGVGGLIGMAVPQEKVVIKGPWEKAQVGIEGQLQFLKGDQMLAVYYLTSSTDRRGAVKLAAQAIQRM
jgi:hypothetical protein